MDEHLSRRYITAPLMQSTRDSNEAGSLLSLLDLAPDGGCLAACIAAGAGGLLHHLFTIPLLRPLLEERVGVRCFFLWPYQQLRLTARHSGCYPASCPVECGLSSTSRRRPRSSDQPGEFIILLWWKYVNWMERMEN